MPIQPIQLRPPVDFDRDHVDGPADAGVTLVEYGDYQCGYCRRAHVGIGRIREQRLPWRVRYVFRHLPNIRMHPDAARRRGRRPGPVLGHARPSIRTPGRTRSR